ncbi:MAG: TIR domain-containing protein [Aggregatilineales bacterium]
MNKKASLFIGSSSEGLDVAREVEFHLQDVAEVTIWNEGLGVFKLGASYLESLINSLDNFDFAVLVLTPDDFVVSRDVSSQGPRDNVMFELGLFMGRLGRSRTFIIYDADTQVKIPTDLSGVHTATFHGQRSDDNLAAAIGPACHLIRKTIKSLGILPSRNVEQLQQATDRVKNASSSMERLIELLARSRALELDITANMFGSMIPSAQMQQLKQDLEDFQLSLKAKQDDQAE